jgi:hypothetical protein
MKNSNHKENKFISVLMAAINSGIDLLGRGKTHSSQSQDQGFESFWTEKLAKTIYFLCERCNQDKHCNGKA